MVRTPNIVERKKKMWIREKRRYEVIVGCLPQDAPDVVKVKYWLIERFIEDLIEIERTKKR